jgi:translocation and assembly module TamB
MNRFLKILMIITLFVVVLVLIALSALQTDWARTRVKTEIEHTANEHLNGRLSIGTLSGSLLWNLTLKDVTFKDSAGTLFSISQISIGYELLALFQDTLLITRVEMLKPELHLRRDQEQAWNISRVLKPPETDSPPSKPGKQEFQIMIRAMQIRDGLIRVQPQPGTVAPPLNVGFQMKAALKDWTVFMEELKVATPKSSATLTGRAGLVPGHEQFDLTCKLCGVWLPEISFFAQVNLPDRLVKGEFTVKGSTKKANLTFRLNPDNKQLLDGNAQVHLEDPMRLEIECDMKAVQLQPWLPSLTATVNGGVRVVLTNNQPTKMSGQANINLFSSSFFGQELERAQVSLSVKPGLHTVLEAELAGPSGDLTLSGAGALSGLFFSRDSLEGYARLNSKKADLSSLDVGIRTVEKLIGELKFQKEAGQPLEETRMAADIAIGPSRWQDVRVEAGSLVGDYRNGRFSIRKAEFKLPGAFLKVIGAGDVRESVAAEINLNFQDLTPLSLHLLHQPLHGTADLSLHVSGKTVRPRVQGTISGSNISGFGAGLHSFRLEVLGDTATLSAQASFYGTRFRYEDGEVAVLNIAGIVSPEKAAFKARAEIDSDSLLELSASIADLNQPSNRLVIQPVRLMVKGAEWKNVQPIVAVLNPDSVQVKALELVRGNQRVSAAGSLALKGSSDVSLTLKNVRMNEIMTMAGLDVPSEGLIDCQLRLTGTPVAPTMAVDTRITKVKWRSYELSLLTLHLNYAGQSASVRTMLHSPAGDTLCISGTIPINLSLEKAGIRISDRGLDLSVEGRRISLGLLPRLIPALVDVQARADIRATMKGNPFDPEVNGTLAVDGEKILIANFSEPILHLRAEAAFGNRQIQLRRFIWSLGERGKIELHGNIGLKGFQLDTKGLKLDVEGSGINLGLLPRLIPELAEVQARADIKATLRGNPFDPQVDGTLVVDGEKILLQDLSEPIWRLRMEAFFNNQEIQIKNLACSLGKKGRMAINGTAHVKRLRLTDIILHAQLRDVPIQVDKKAKGTVTADITAEGTLDALRIQGNAGVTEGIFYADQIIEMSDDVVIMETEVLGEKKAKPTGGFGQRILTGLTLDARLHIPGNVWVKGLGVNVELKGDLTAGKKPEKTIIINGELTTIRGFYEFKRKTFRIERGKVQFIGLPEPDPLLDIQAAYHIDEVAIYLVVGGSLSKITLSLNSNPSMDETDIMAYLLFGKPVNKLGRSESNKYQQMALDFFGAGVTAKLKQVLGKKFSLDVIALEGTSTGFGAGTLSLGKYISPRIFVTYKHVMGLESKNQVEAEYEINNRFSIESTIGDNATTGADIFWRHEY